MILPYVLSPDVLSGFGLDEVWMLQPLVLSFGKAAQLLQASHMSYAIVVTFSNKSYYAGQS